MQQLIKMIILDKYELKITEDFTFLILILFLVVAWDAILCKKKTRMNEGICFNEDGVETKEMNKHEKKL